LKSKITPIDPQLSNAFSNIEASEIIFLQDKIISRSKQKLTPLSNTFQKLKQVKIEEYTKQLKKKEENDEVENTNLPRKKLKTSPPNQDEIAQLWHNRLKELCHALCALKLGENFFDYFSHIYTDIQKNRPKIHSNEIDATLDILCQHVATIFTSILRFYLLHFDNKLNLDLAQAPPSFSKITAQLYIVEDRLQAIRLIITLNQGMSDSPIYVNIKKPTNSTTQKNSFFNQEDSHGSQQTENRP